jgi:hypothetical protein
MKLKLVDLALFVGLVLGLAPWIFLKEPNSYWLIISVTGGLLCAIAGYNAQARGLGQGEPGEELLQKAWHWFRVNVLRQQIDPMPPTETAGAHQSLTPKPALSPLSKTVQGIGLVLVITPTILGWQVGNDWRMGFIALGSVFIIVARKTLPPQSPNDPPHGKELLQAAWGWLQQRLKGKL